jgi:catechol 2,3-dioxygenase-like lactoylglutathione lyase family enzyme
MNEQPRGADVGVLEVGIVVRDLEAVTPFYRDGLGLRHIMDLRMPFDDVHAVHNPNRGTNRRFAYGDNIIKLLQWDEPPMASNPPGGAYGITGLRYISLLADDPEEVVRRCVEAGGRVVIPVQLIQGIAGPTKYSVVEDPEGNAWIEVGWRRRSVSDVKAHG